jgi:hypothetical protein
MFLKRSIFIIPFFILSLSFVAHSETIYEWVDVTGSKHSTLRPPKGFSSLLGAFLVFVCSLMSNLWIEPETLKEGRKCLKK